MKKIIVVITLTVINVTLLSQGFQKKSKAERIGIYELGNYYLYKHSADSVTVYSFTMRDKEYNSNNFIQVIIGNKEETIEFFENFIVTIDSMEKGDQFELGLPEGNKGFYYNLLGVKTIGITVGNIGEWGFMNKTVANNMLKDMRKEK
ncbi:MAG: hypothetical protein LBP67_05235 [Bacteroidales bacterium]|jgi:hypothetical protein|nr:hypothetical protein [Bacteroidales bacterium]